MSLEEEMVQGYSQHEIVTVITLANVNLVYKMVYCCLAASSQRDR